LDLNLVVGGPQGGGIETAGLLAVKTLAMQGLEVFVDREYHSNIKGKHSYAHIRASDRPVRSLKYPIGALGALDVETLVTHFHEVMEGGFVVYDALLSGKPLTATPSIDRYKGERVRAYLEEHNVGKTVGDLGRHLSGRGIKIVEAPISESISELLKFPNPLIARTMNTSITTSILALVGIGRESIRGAVASFFSEKRNVADVNLKVVDLVYEIIKPHIKAAPVRIEARERRLLVSGNDSVAIGKVLGGGRFQTYYPITPAADESFTIEEHTRLLDGGGNLAGAPVVIQAEDEISAVGMAIGGALTGARSATSTSGPGFSLMVEGLGWAGNNEVPIVITYYQRGGPSTGLPTRHSQSDLLFSIFAGHGEFARMILASGNHEEAMMDAIKAFNYAETYQLPVIHLLDKGLANTAATVPLPDGSEILRGRRVGETGAGLYRRFQFTADGISPRAFLGEMLMWYTGDEHDEFGHINEDPVNRTKMYDKRMRKLEKILKEVPEEDKACFFGPDNYDDLIVTWGITTGAVLDAIGDLGEGGRRVSVLQVRLMDPFPAGYISSFLSQAGEVIAAEANYLGQLAERINHECQRPIDKRILKYNGRLITEDEVVSAYTRILKGESRVVLTGGE